ncbi:MAG TPA: T9SS type A sorting domain-containing protein [Rhodothermales bacterium]
MSKSFAVVLLFLFLAIPAGRVSPVAAQSHFNNCISRTGNSAHLLIPAGTSATIGGAAAAAGDELAVYAPGGGCAGMVAWGTTSRALTIWGDNSATSSKDSFVPGDSLRFVFWDASAQTEYQDVTVQLVTGVSYYNASGRFAADAVYVLSSLSATAGVQAPSLSTPEAGARVVPLSPTLRWEAMTGAQTYEVQVSADSLFGTLVVNRTGLTGTSTQVSGLEQNRKYFWRVRAQRATGPTAYATASFTTLARQTIQLGQGWNLVSGRVLPVNAQLDDIFGADVVMVKDGSGAMYYPEFNIDGIGEWDATAGYMVYARAAHTLNLEGEGVTQTTPIPLSAGWNMMAYLPTTAMSPQMALAGIADKVVLLKNGAGDVWMPEFNLNTIGTLQPGAGYQIHVRSAANLVYATSVGKNGDSSDGDAPATAAVANNATLLVLLPLQPDGHVVTARAGGRIVGQATVESGKALLIIRGDDELTTDVVEGARAGEVVSVSAGIGASEREVTGSVRDLLSGEVADQIIYQADRVWVADVNATGAESDQPSAFQLQQNYPNPFNPTTTIEYALPEAANVKLEVFNALGQRVRVLVDDSLPAGQHRIEFQADGLPSGVYFYKLQAGAHASVRQMTLLK